MILPVRLDDAAVDDLDRIVTWYDRQVPGLGYRFVDDLSRTISRVARFPNAYARVHRSVRRARVGRFPYFVAYEEYDGELVVLGVFAEAQHPMRLSQRAGE